MDFGSNSAQGATSLEYRDIEMVGAFAKDLASNAPSKLYQDLTKGYRWNVKLPCSFSTEGGVAALRRRRKKLQDAPGDCLQLEPLDVPGDSFRTARSQSMSTASCLQDIPKFSG